MRFSSPKNLLNQKLATEQYTLNAIANATITVSQLPVATNETPGIIRIATDLEAVDMSDSTVAVNPKQLSRFVPYVSSGDLTITAHGVTYTLTDGGLKIGNTLIANNNGMINEDALPNRAITSVKTINASASGNTEKTLIQLFQSLGMDKFEEGDVVIVTADSDERAAAVGGNYMFNKVVQASAITSADYNKLYTPPQTIYTVNNVSPVGTNITLALSDITNKATLLENITVASDVLTVDGVAFNSASKTTTEINTKVNAIGSAISGHAVEFTEVTKVLDNATDGVSIESNVVTCTIAGRVMAVYDGDGILIQPDITVTKNGNTITSTVVGDFSPSGTLDTSWTFLVATTITAPNASAYDESDESDSN